MLELDAAGAFVQVDVLDLEQAPATLAQALHVVLEHRHAFQAMALGFLFTPVPGGLVAGLVEDLGIGVGAQNFLDADVVVDEEMARHVQHRQGVAGPDTGLAVDFDWQLRGDLGHGNSTPYKFLCGCPGVAGRGYQAWRAAYSPQTSLRTLTQFSPMILRTTRSEWPRLSKVSVRLGNSPTVRMPSGLMILPKLVRRRA